MDVTNVSSMAAYVSRQTHQQVEKSVNIEVLKASLKMQEEVMRLTMELVQQMGNLGQNIDISA